MAAKKCPFSTAPGQPEVGIPVTGTRRRRAHRAGAFCFLCCDHYLKPSEPGLAFDCAEDYYSAVIQVGAAGGCGCRVRVVSGWCRRGYGMRVTSIAMPPASTFVNAVRTALCASRDASLPKPLRHEEQASQNTSYRQKMGGFTLPCGEFLNISRSHLVIYCLLIG
jgi:hypothetical protein